MSSTFLFIILALNTLKSVRDSNFHFEEQNMFMILSLGEYLASVCV